MLDLIVALLLLPLVAPLLISIALLIRLTSPGPVMFRQSRLGMNHRMFQLSKFRTMRDVRNMGPQLTRAGDPRVTTLGRWLRACKMDELPQLVNVLRGEMSLVGPRPDLPEIWAKTAESYRSVLRLQPGLTGMASLTFRKEEHVLAQVPAEQLEHFYLTAVLPRKCRLDIDYAAHATFWSDCVVLLRTVFASLLPEPITAVALPRYD